MDIICHKLGFYENTSAFYPLFPYREELHWGFFTYAENGMKILIAHCILSWDDTQKSGLVFLNYLNAIIRFVKDNKESFSRFISASIHVLNTKKLKCRNF